MAITQKQLGNVFRVQDVPDDGEVGTPEDLSIVRAFIFLQITPGVSVTFPAPSATDTERTIPVVNRGSVPITVENVVIKPGPVYGFFWDGFNYTPAIVEGTGTVSFTESGPGTEIDGNGEENNPLRIEIKLSDEANNALKLLPDGLYYAPTIPGSRLIWVDSQAGSDNNDGSFMSPVASITAAMSLATLGDSVAIAPGTYVENVTFLAGIYVFAFGGTIDSPARVRITGVSTLAASVFENIDFSNTNTAPAEITNIASARFLGCRFGRSDSTTDTVISVNSGNSGTIQFDDCSIAGNVAISAVQSTPVIVNIARPRSMGSIRAESPAATVNVYDALEVGSVVHTAGKLTLSRIGRIKKDGVGTSISSLADADANNRLALSELSLLQEDGTYGNLLKTGDCEIVIAKVDRRVVSDTIEGTRILSFSADDIRAGFAPSSYTPTDASVRAHLQAIDAAIANIAVTVTTQDSDSIHLTGQGTAVSPLIAEAIIDPNPANRLSVTENGLLVEGSNIATGRVLWVDKANGDDANTGNFGDAFATINAALAVAVPATVIKVFPNTYVEDLDFSSVSKQNILIEGFGVVDGSVVEIQGHVTIGGDHTRSKFHNVTIEGTINGVPTVRIQDCTGGRLKWDAVSISHAGGSEETAIEWVGNNERWYEFVNCGITGKVRAEDPNQISPVTIKLLNLFDTINEVVVDSDQVLFIVSALVIGKITHKAGNLKVENISYFNTSEAVAIESTANTGSLILKDVSVIDETGNHVTLVKSGNCPYAFINVARRFLVGQVISGTSLIENLAADINASYVPQVYVTDSPSVADHLKGIDKLLTTDAEFLVNFTGGWVDQENLLTYPVKNPFILPENLAESLYIVDFTTVFNGEIEVYHNADLIGEIQFSGNSVTAVVTETLFEAGSVLKLIAVGNSTFNHVAINISAIKVAP